MIKKTFSTLKNNKRIFILFALYSAVGIVVITICEFIMYFIPNLPETWVSLWERDSDIRAMEIVSILVSYIILIVFVQPLLIKYAGLNDKKGLAKGIYRKSLTRGLKQFGVFRIITAIIILWLFAIVFGLFTGIVGFDFTSAPLGYWELYVIFMSIVPIGYLSAHFGLSNIIKKENIRNYKLFFVIKCGITYIVSSSIPLAISLVKIFYLTDYVYYDSYHMYTGRYTVKIAIDIMNKFGMDWSYLMYFLICSVILAFTLIMEALLLAFVNTYFANKIMHDSIQINNEEDKKNSREI